MNTHIGLNALRLKVIREEVLEDDDTTDESLMRTLARDRHIPRVMTNADFNHTPDPELVFSGVEAEFARLGFQVSRLTTQKNHSYNRAHVLVSSVNRKTEEIRMRHLVVVIVEGKFASITSFLLP